ncbi:hypothetical protein MSG28_008209 [Choristoneura fumiferana]|uniref:Uncharacterized protein n=1 Tax=Choristoneura fumiferana TaxID=7141 RepID=A0ACC0JAF7_CHOFU|nr:hypothetical protein MSG28_008209 [Choristoneura fumiferana]
MWSWSSRMNTAIRYNKNKVKDVVMVINGIFGYYERDESNQGQRIHLHSALRSCGQDQISMHKSQVPSHRLRHRYAVFFVPSKKGRRLILNGYSYYKHQEISLKVRWRCSMHGRGCRACAFTVEDELIYYKNCHNHPPTDDGSEEESDSEDDELEAPVLVPRVLRVLWETPVDEEEKVAKRAAPSSAPEDEDVQVAERAAPSSAASESYRPHNFLDFEWRSFPNPPIPPETRREPFRPTDCGPTIRVTDPYDIFTAIWDREFMEFVATETNLYAEEVAEKMMHTGELCLNSRIVDWKDTTADELYIYMAIILAMGVVIKSRTEDYWNTEMDIFCTPGFCVNMSLRRFQLLNKCLHFNSTTNMIGLNLSAPEAKLFKVQPVISHLNAKFSALYKMQQNIALDESLLQWKGRLDINQFIPNKAAAVGFKSYEICESATGYLWRFQIHAPKPRTPQAAQDEDPFTASTPALVLDLIKGLEHAGYTLWMDNFYNSPALARKLKSIGFDCVGTLRTNRKLVPVELTTLTKTSMRPGQIAGFTSGDVDAMVWRDQNRVATISTYHGNAVSTVDNTTKPIVIRDYNVCMGGVDKKDQMLATYPIERKRTRIWYKKLFRRLLNVSTLNAYIIHKKNATVKLPHRNFRRTLINTILEKHGKPAVMPTPAGKVVYTISRKGRPLLIYKGFTYYHRPGNSAKMRWYCSSQAGCRATLCTLDDEVVFEKNDHDHPPPVTVLSKTDKE